eukprot:m.39541 g.39541  ORF g.39541 m.39541 type:complete len:320 (-) comp14728_c0_seq1:244-1203(-)
MSIREKIKQRLAISLLVACTKMFPCGFGWQLLGFAAPSSFSEMEFACLTGAGDAIGVFCGNLLQSVILRACTHSAGHKEYQERRRTKLFGSFFLMAALCDSIILAIGGFCSGTTWQPMVNTVSSTIESFTIGALVVGLACGTAFFVGVSLSEFCTSEIMTKQTVFRNVTLSVAVCGGAAFFVGTDAAYKGNWLVNVVGERKGETIPYEAVKAGWSTVLGYLAFQLVMLLVVPMGWLWTEAPHEWDHKESPNFKCGDHSLIKSSDDDEEEPLLGTGDAVVSDDDGMDFGNGTLDAVDVGVLSALSINGESADEISVVQAR